MGKTNRFNAICAVCGSPATVGSLCDKHYTNQTEFVSVENLDLLLCDNCNSVFDQKWSKHPIEDVIRRAIIRTLKSHGKLDNVDIGLVKVGKDYVATITATGTVPPSKMIRTSRQEIRVSIRILKCPSCVKLLGRYHEAVLQVRGDRVERLTELVENAALGMAMTAERLKYGWNVYFVHKSDARKVVNTIERALVESEEKPLDVIRSHKVVGKKDGKMLMRDFCAVR